MVPDDRARAGGPVRISGRSRAIVSPGAAAGVVRTPVELLPVLDAALIGAHEGPGTGMQQIRSYRTLGDSARARAMAPHCSAGRGSTVTEHRPAPRAADFGA